MNEYKVLIADNDLQNLIDYACSKNCSSLSALIYAFVSENTNGNITITSLISREFKGNFLGDVTLRFSDEEKTYMLEAYSYKWNLQEIIDWSLYKLIPNAKKYARAKEASKHE